MATVSSDAAPSLPAAPSAPLDVEEVEHSHDTHNIETPPRHNIETSPRHNLETSPQLSIETPPLASPSRPDSPSSPASSPSPAAAGADAQRNHTARLTPDPKKKSYYHWSDADTARLLEVIFSNDLFARALVPGRTPGSATWTVKTRKNTLWKQVFREVFPGEDDRQADRVKTKFRNLIDSYRKIKAKMSFTGAGSLLRDMNPEDPAGPALLLTSSGYDDSASRCNDSSSVEEADKPMELTEDDDSPQTASGRGLPPLDAVLQASQDDPFTNRVLRGNSFEPSNSTSSESHFSNSTPATPAAPRRRSATTAGLDDSPQMQPSFGKRGRKDTSSARETWSQAFITSNNAALQAKVRIEEERTKREALRLQHQREERESQERAREAEKERDQRSREAERNFSLEMMRLVVTGKGFQLPILNDNNDSTTGAAFSLGRPAA
ncbi:uncharacterized protein UTRI_02243 [Ustilago trichophora]|uniref:Uncharacterized protein n=1 Tax=Ustilago trichophora TaxID=86804 RepID=A0A5C3DYN6_9BASI|nr:uncharacterized protein UTRI_02243 [Ustilago trichophora]